MLPVPFFFYGPADECIEHETESGRRRVSFAVMNRVAITGIGVISTLGNNTDTVSQKTDEKNKGTLFDMLFAPEQKFIKSSFVCQCCQFILLSP